MHDNLIWLPITLAALTFAVVFGLGLTTIIICIKEQS